MENTPGPPAFVIGVKNTSGTDLTNLELMLPMLTAWRRADFNEDGCLIHATHTIYSGIPYVGYNEVLMDIVTGPGYDITKTNLMFSVSQNNFSFQIGTKKINGTTVSYPLIQVTAPQGSDLNQRIMFDRSKYTIDKHTSFILKNLCAGQDLRMLFYT